MIYKTSLSGVKTVAQTLLMTDLHTTKLSPLVVHHPFTSCGITSVRSGDRKGYTMLDLTASRENLERWRGTVRRSIENAETPFQIFYMLNKAYYLTFLKLTEPYLSQKDFSEILSNAWILCEMPHKDANVTPRQLVSMFKKADPAALMEPEELEKFQALPPEITVYRGVTPYNEKNRKGLSWTLKPETAQWFARRFGEQGKVYQAQVSKDHIFAYFAGRNEAEVILDPKRLQNIRLSKELTYGQMQGEDQEIYESEGMEGMQL